MKYTIMAFWLFSAGLAWGQEIEWPDTKYRPGDCITTIDPLWTWYGKAAIVAEIVYAQELEGFFYYIRIQNDPVWIGDLFAIKTIDDYTAKLTSCPP
jgi:hypothetical protein